MNENSVLVAIEASLRSPAFCACGESLDLSAHDGALWLECRSLTRPSRLPAPVAAFLRSGFHDREFVSDLPTAESTEAADEGHARAVDVRRAIAAGARGSSMSKSEGRA